MKWHKIEDYPKGFYKHVLVSHGESGDRYTFNCTVAKLDGDQWYNISNNEKNCWKAQPTDRWCYIDLPED